MQTVRLPLTRGALFLIALAAIAFILARGDNPAAATTYDPHVSVSVSNANPGAAADIVINFSVDAPDSFPNVKTNSSIQFLPTGWGIHKDAPIGGIAGTFNALTNLGIFGSNPCIFSVQVPFTMMDASVDTSVVTSTLDVGGGLHPGGVGFSGQFAPDPDTTAEPTDLNLPLVNFNADEKYTYSGSGHIYSDAEDLYRDADGDGWVSAGDVRLTDYDDELSQDSDIAHYPAGSVVQAGDADVILWSGQRSFPLANFPSPDGNEKHSEINGNGQMDPGENMYRDVNRDGKVSYGDIRLFKFAQLRFGSVVQLFELPGGVHRYPDFLNQMIDPSVVGDPLARQFAIKDVLGTPVSLNIVTYHPGQLPGYPETLGYPNVVVLLDPVAPIEAVSINQTSDLCAPLSLTSTNFGVSQDNTATAADESGYARLTNPKAEKDHTFTLVTTSQPDADDDGIENMLDTCPFDPNTPGSDPDGRTQDPDTDGLDKACDPQEDPPPDIGRALVPFNWNEKLNGNNIGLERGHAIYRDNDSSGNVTPGDDRLMARDININTGGGVWEWYTVAPGVVQDSDADYRNPVTGAVLGDRTLNRFTHWAVMPLMRHSENVAANGRYDVGEDVYRDDDRSNNVSINDWRLLSVTVYEGRMYYQMPPQDRFVRYLRTSPLSPWFRTPDEDQDNYANRADNCPLVPNGIEVIGRDYKLVPGFTFWWAITGDLIGPSNQTDSDGDDIGDACDPNPAVIDGHMHVVTLTQDVSIAAHGIALKDLNGKNKLNSGGSADYAVIVNNTARTPEDIPVALKVEGGCGAVDGVAGQNTQTVRVNGNSSKAVKFTVDFTGCLGGEYIVRADACHAGDPTGLFGSSPCPGASDVPQPPSEQLTPSGATASWESSNFYGFNFLAKNAIDTSSSTSWCHSSFGGGPVAFIQASFSSPASVDRVDIENSQYSAYGFSFASGTLTFSNGYSQPVTLTNGAGSFSVPLQSGVTWVKFTGPVPASGFGCMSEFKTFGFIPVAGDPNAFDDAPMAMSVEVGP